MLSEFGESERARVLNGCNPLFWRFPKPTTHYKATRQLCTIKPFDALDSDATATCNAYTLIVICLMCLHMRGERQIHQLPLSKSLWPFGHQLGMMAEGSGRKVSKSGFVPSAIPELKAGLCRGKYQLHKASLVASMSGLGFCASAARPASKVL
jgi:hypothetical protein